MTARARRMWRRCWPRSPRADQRIRVLRTPSNVGIAAAVNFGLRAARGDYVAFMDHDDALEPDAVYHLLRAGGAQTGADLIYSDEVRDRRRHRRSASRCAPARRSATITTCRTRISCTWSASAPRSRSALAGWDESLPISADVDFVLRAIEQADAVAHVPRRALPLAHARGQRRARPRSGVMEATKAALAAPPAPGSARRARGRGPAPATTNTGSTGRTMAARC